MHGDMRPKFREAHRHVAAKAAARAGDERNLAFQFLCHFFLTA